MSNGNNRADVAVFIDFENVYVSVRDKLDANPNFESIMDRCADLGRIVISKAYADWYRYPRVTSALYANGIEPMYVPTYYYDRDMGRTGRAIKNSVDIHICIDAMKTLFTNINIEKFVLVTGDRDFIPLVNSIRQQGKEVIVIGIGGAASAHLAQSADEFIFYEQIVGLNPKPIAVAPPAELLDDRPRARMPEKERERAPEYAPPTAAPAPQPVALPTLPPVAVAAAAQSDADVFDTLVEAIKLARKRNYVSTLGSLKLLMKELMGGDFRENRYRDANGRPFAKFKDFVIEAERRGKVQVFTSGTVNEVFLPEEDPQKLSQFASILTEGEPGTGIEVELLEPSEATEEPAAPPAPVSRSRRRRRRGSRDKDGVLIEGEGLVEGDELPSDELVAIVAADLGIITEPLLDLSDDFDDFEAPELAEADSFVEEPTVLVNEAEVLADAPGLEQAAEALAEDLVAEAAADRLMAQQAEEQLLVAEEPVAEEPVAAPAASSFSDEEWALFYRTLSGFEKAVSFRQIFDALRDLRNEKQIKRTNLELETMLKDAINDDRLERSGRGARITYRLRPEFRTGQPEAIPTAEASLPAALVEEEASIETPAEDVQELEDVSAGDAMMVEDSPVAEAVPEEPTEAPAETPAGAEDAPVAEDAEEPGDASAVEDRVDDEQAP